MASVGFVFLVSPSGVSFSSSGASSPSCTRSLGTLFDAMVTVAVGFSAVFDTGGDSTGFVSTSAFSLPSTDLGFAANIEIAA